MPPPNNVHALPTTEALTSALADYVDAALSAASSSPRFTVAVSGGSLPKLLGLALAKLAATTDLRSEQWHVFYADERVVPLDHADSNHAAMHAAVYNQVRRQS